MDNLATIREQDINPEAPERDPSGFAFREAVRAIVVDSDGHIPLLNVTRKGYHKLPGGGIDSGEGRTEALERELLEEIGCTAEVLTEIGQITQYRDQWDQIQVSYCYLAKQIGDQQETELTEQEQADGYETVWAENIDAAIRLLEVDNPTSYGGIGIRLRDLHFLRAAKPLIAKNPL